MPDRFLTLSDVAEMLNVAPAQVAIKIGARGQWRVENRLLENYIATLYAATAEFVALNPR